MEVEFSPIQIGEEVSVKMQMVHWLEVCNFLEFIKSMPDMPQLPTGAGILTHKLFHVVTTEAWRKSALAQIAEHEEQQMRQHPLVALIKRFNGDDDDDDDTKGDPRIVGS